MLTAEEHNSPETSVRVAVRIRPQISREVIDMCQICTSVTPGEPQVWLGKDKAFTYDYVFDTDSKQVEIYDTCVKNLVEGCFSGYNATVLAYGQTGSGKTYTMGTGFEPSALGDPDDNSRGIVTRAVNHIFDGIERRKREAKENNQLAPEFKVAAQFLELYNEEIIDLLDETHNNNHSKQIFIRQENGTIQMSGVTTRPVDSVDEAFNCLRVGALSRTTASTQMNTQSSRSHAIFTLSIHQTRVACSAQDVETLSAKFHFVDLAGSERLKRTGATGERAKEGISINTGLLCLGNVISALGDKSKKASHVPYRDSKLTRLLQDSLGGNSQTLMIACISPSDRDFMETLNTLRYANRAKNITNKVTVNHDTSSHTIAMLRKEIQELKLELSELKQGKRMIGDDGTEYVNDMYHENAMLLSEIQNLKTRNKALQEANERLISRNAEVIANSASPEVKDIVQRYLMEIEELRVKLLEMEETCSNLRKHNVNRTSLIPTLNESEISSDKVIEDAKREVKKLKAYTKLINNGISGDQDNTAHSIQDSCDSNETDGDDDVLDSSEEASEDNAIEKAKLELVQLNDDISTKELLIAELEKSQRKMQSLKHHYESKLIQLQTQIAEIEKERDQVLIKLSQSGNKTDEKTKKVHDDYDKKIKALQCDLKKLQDAKKEHAIAMKNQAKYEQQVRKLRNEVGDMKRQKVTVMNKMKEEASRHRVSELQSTKRIAQLTKQERLKDVKIKNLEVENSRIKQTLKRKDAEVKALKTKSKLTSARMLRNSPKLAKNKWGKIEHEINQLIVTRQAIWNYDQQMGRDIEQRQELSEHLEDTMMRLREARRRNEAEVVRELSEDVESISSNIRYLDQNIRDCQSTILQLEDDLNNDGDIPNLDSVISNSDSVEMKYLFQKILAMLINQTQQANVLNEECRQWEFKYRQVADTSRIREELLDHVLNSSTSKLERDLCGGSTDTFIVTTDSSRYSEPRRVPSPIMMPPPSSIPKQKQNLVDLPGDEFFPRPSACEKARRLTRTPQELLFEPHSN